MTRDYTNTLCVSENRSMSAQQYVNDTLYSRLRPILRRIMKFSESEATVRINPAAISDFGIDSTPVTCTV